jgi:hypothetical protein
MEGLHKAFMPSLLKSAEPLPVVCIDRSVLIAILLGQGDEEVIIGIVSETE